MLESAKAAYRQMNTQIRAGNLPEALKLFEAMPEEFDVAKERIFHRPIAAAQLVFGYLHVGNLPEARKLFENMATLGEAQELSLLRAEVAYNLVVGYLKAGNLPEAREMLKAMETLGEAPTTTSLRDEAAHNLIIGYLKAGLFSEAQQLFESMAAPDPRRRPKERWGEYSSSSLSALQKNCFLPVD